MMPNTTIVPCTCPFCGKVERIHISTPDFTAWQNGGLIQDVAPYLSAEERETLISGLCPACQDSFFSEEDEDEDPED
jgi:hypothetical protein